jgi:hypothetical protein
MDQDDKQKRTLGQRAFDNIWFLLIIGMAFPGIFYLGWGMLEIFVFNNTQLKDYLAQSNQQYLLPGK